MKTYVFRDCNNLYCDDYAEFDIAGEEYKKLITLCCNMSSTLSFILDTRCDINLAEKLESFRVPIPENIKYVQHSYDGYDVRYYRICPEIKDLLINSAHSIFQWIHGWDFANPENPTFYREDGNVFFTSEIHDGELFLIIKESENIFDTISDNNWNLISDSEEDFKKTLEKYYRSIYSGDNS